LWKGESIAVDLPGPKQDKHSSLSLKLSLASRKKRGEKFYEIEMRLTATKGTEKANKEESVPHIS
jgi:hypothetical protein